MPKKILNIIYIIHIIYVNYYLKILNFKISSSTKQAKIWNWKTTNSEKKTIVLMFEETEMILVCYLSKSFVLENRNINFNSFKYTFFDTLRMRLFYFITETIDLN